MIGRPLILSASRRTDLPGFHAAECAKRIRIRVARLRTRQLYGVVFWTRHVKPFLKNGLLHPLITQEIPNPIVNLTITGLGGSSMEPGCPSLDETLPLLPLLIKSFHGNPWRICWRFDPIIKGHSTLALFNQIATVMKDNGINRCTFSFPAYQSLKGNLSKQFKKGKINKWRENEKIEVLHRLVDASNNLGIQLFSCCQPQNTVYNPAIKPAQCISQKLLEKGHPTHAPLALGKDWGQRAACNCIESEDIGDYNTDKCLGGCVYCYSKAGGPL